MLYIDVPVTAKSMEEWILADGLSKHRVAVDKLIQLRVFTEIVDRYTLPNPFLLFHSRWPFR